MRDPLLHRAVSEMSEKKELPVIGVEGSRPVVIVGCVLAECPYYIIPDQQARRYHYCKLVGRETWQVTHCSWRDKAKSDYIGPGVEVTNGEDWLTLSDVEQHEVASSAETQLSKRIAGLEDENKHHVAAITELEKRAERAEAEKYSSLRRVAELEEENRQLRASRDWMLERVDRLDRRY